MGDRTNPIKFGPEWLRNLSCEPSSPGGPGREGPGNPRATSPGAGGPPSHQRTSNTCPSTHAPKVLLAKLRYGREEMLALYDRQTAEAPVHLKTIEVLYQPRGKPPYALNNTFEEETRDTMRGQSSVGPGTADRYTITGRGRAHITLGMTENRGRALSAGENRGRARGYNRQTSVGRATPNWHGGNQRNSYSGMPDDDPNQALRPWNNNTSSGLRPNNTEQPDWQTKQQQYRTKRQPSSNWRQQQSRDDGEEWRSGDPARRPQEKWEWEWQEGRGRPNQENKSWHSNRRTWVGGENNEDPLPEWAMDNAEACGGTFDSSGAFHGYSNDDSNLPKNQEPAYTLARSQTHGSFVRSKTVEEGSEEWWASEKAKKLSPKRFDASEIKFKKSVAPGNEDEKSNSKSASSATTSSNGHNTGAIPKNSYQASGSERASKIIKSNVRSISTGDDDMSSENKVAAVNLHPEENKHAQMEDTSKENKFDSRSDTDKSNEEKGNFKSVILTQNNSLREKHQNIAVTPTETPKRQANQNIMHFFDSSKEARQVESDEKQKEKENKLVEDILQMSLDDAIPSATMTQLLTNHSNSAVNSLPQPPTPSMQMRMASPLDGLVLSGQNKHNMQPSSDMQPTRLQSSMMHPIGITNSMLNASLGLPMPISNSGLPLQGMNPSLPNAGLSSQNMLASTLQGMSGGNMQSAALQGGNMQAGALQSNLQGIPLPGLPGSGMQVGGLQSNMQPGGMSNNGLQSGVGGLPGFPSASMPGMSNNTSLFNNMPNANDMSNHGGQNMFPMHGLQQSSSQSFNNSIFGSMMNQPLPPLPNMGMHHSMDQWFYEDPNKTIQGPFSSKEMYNWFRAGFFSPTLMVRRACEAVMRPLGTYGHTPFGQMDLLPPYPMSGGFDLRPQQSHDNMMNPQPNLGIDMESLWGQPANNTPAPDHMWMQSMNNNSRNDSRVNNLPMYFWDNQPTAMPTTPMLPEDIKTEDEILAQMRASQPPKPVSPLSFLEPPATSPENSFNAAHPALDMEHLQKLIQSEEQTAVNHKVNDANQQKQDNAAKADAIFDTPAKTPSKVADIKLPKDVSKLDNNGKPAKAKETATKSKKNKEIKKDDKREESVENKTKEEDIKAKARSAEPSPSKNKKEDKLNKKEIEKEKKEWIKEGFTIVKNTEKNKDKKKADEAKAAEEGDRKKKEEEKQLAEEKKRQQETTKKQQEVQNQQQTPHQRQVLESVSKKAPWSASSQGLQANSRDGPTLAEIQRLEREKKLEQMKEQQQMMQLIAQQQAAALAREQEVQTGLGWAKKIPQAENQSQTLAEIQAEARKQAAAAAAAATAAAAAASAAAREEALATPPLVSSVPWGTAQNGGATNSGFWDTPSIEIAKPMPKQVEVSKQAEPKAKKKVTVMAPPKKENPPSVEFDMWCNNMLTAWRDTGIDVPTFVCFLKDIESPYEVKDYVKCYLGDTREAGDFARQFLERRSRMLRVGMVTPSDDLCSPAVAINPRTNSGSDYTEVKGKGKKTKKNKMLKVDARNILGFSVTASEDRINVGDIDSV